MRSVGIYFGFVMRMGEVTLDSVKREFDACAVYRQEEDNYEPYFSGSLFNSDS